MKRENTKIKQSSWMNEVEEVALLDGQVKK